MRKKVSDYLSTKGFRI